MMSGETSLQTDRRGSIMIIAVAGGLTSRSQRTTRPAHALEPKFFPYIHLCIIQIYNSQQQNLKISTSKLQSTGIHKSLLSKMKSSTVRVGHTHRFFSQSHSVDQIILCLPSMTYPNILQMSMQPHSLVHNHHTIVTFHPIQTIMTAARLNKCTANQIIPCAAAQRPTLMKQ